jgi:hypothetical protein
MARGTLENRFKRNLIELGKGTLCVTIPKEYLQELGWEKGKELNLKIKKKNKQIIIEEIPGTV